MINTTKRTEGDVTILELDGTLDAEGIVALKEAISAQRQTGCQKILVNMKNVRSIVSAFSHALQSSITAFWTCNGRIVLTDVPTGVLRVLEREKYFKLLAVAQTEEQGLKLFQK